MMLTIEQVALLNILFEILLHSVAETVLTAIISIAASHRRFV